MTREDLRKIIDGITDEQLKSILDINSADIGNAKKGVKGLEDEIESLKSDKKTLETKINDITTELNSAGDYKTQLENLQKEIKEKDEADKKARADAELTTAIEAVFGDRDFTSDYVRNGIITDMKAEIAKPENKGKGYAEIFESLTKDKDGIFKNPNPPANMTGMGKVDTTGITKEQFSKMGYKAKNELFRTNKELYDTLSKE